MTDHGSGLGSDLCQLQFPIGKLLKQETFPAKERLAALEILARFPRQLAVALDGLTEAQLDTPYRPQGWTIRQLVHHLADSHMSAYLAVRQALTASWPVVVGYDSDAWAGLPEARRLPVALSLQMIDGMHQRWVAMLRDIPEADWAARGYMHSEGGACALERVPLIYAWHSRHHLAHIVNCRERLGW